MQKPITHQRTCKRWPKQLRTCKRWHKQLCTCKRWHKQPRTCKRWLKRTNQVVTCVTNQAPPCVAHPPPNSYKYKPSWDIQEDQNLEVKKLCEDQASKPSRTSRTSTPKSENIRSRIIQIICLDPKICGNQAKSVRKYQQIINQWSSTNSSL